MNEMIDLLRCIAVVCVGLLALVLVIHFSKTILKKKSIKTILRSSKADGIVLGLTKLGRHVISPSNDEGHSFVVGGSGSGKTSAVLIPTLRRWNGTFWLSILAGIFLTMLAATTNWFMLHAVQKPSHTTSFL